MLNLNKKEAAIDLTLTCPLPHSFKSKKDGYERLFLFGGTFSSRLCPSFSSTEVEPVRYFIIHTLPVDAPYCGKSEGGGGGGGSRYR